ncbi:MAG: hypothetical protein IV090_09710 [Candidatus Sericytochromatia bacterium]|nr:hypothetical protein [Candidatus Sericytochromatia bacterium]
MFKWVKMGVAEILGVKMGRIHAAALCFILAACQPVPSNPGASPLSGASQSPSPSQPNATQSPSPQPSASALPTPTPVPTFTEEPFPIRSLPPETPLLGSALTVLAGSDVAGFQDGKGEFAKFNKPLSLAVDNEGYVYIADTYNHAIRKISPDGQVSTIAGIGKPGYIDGEGKTSQFQYPKVLTVDDSEQIFVIEGLPFQKTVSTDSVLSRIRKINKTKEVSTLKFDSSNITFLPLYDIYWDKNSDSIYCSFGDFCMSK